MQKNKYNLRVRRSEEKDYEAIVHLMNEWNSELDIKDQANPQIIRKSVELLLKNQKYGIIFMCDDLDINKTIGCAQFLKLNDKIIGGNRMIVQKQSRRKGCFEAVFSYGEEYFRKRGALISKGFAINNDILPKAYGKIGYKKNIEVPFGFSFDDPKIKFTPERFQKPMGDYKVSEVTDKNLYIQKVKKLCQILQSQPSFQFQNLICSKDNQIVGYCQVYKKYNIHSMKYRYYAQVLYCEQKNGRNAIESFLKYLYQFQDFPFSQFYFVRQGPGDKKIFDYFPEGREQDRFCAQKMLQVSPKL